MRFLISVILFLVMILNISADSSDLLKGLKLHREGLLDEALTCYQKAGKDWDEEASLLSLIISFQKEQYGRTAVGIERFRMLYPMTKWMNLLVKIEKMCTDRCQEGFCISTFLDLKKNEVIDVNNPDIHLKYLKMLTGKSEFQKALVYISNLSESLKKNSEVIKIRGIILFQTGEPELAMKVLGHLENDPEAMAILGYFSYGQEQKTQALKFYQKAFVNNGKMDDGKYSYLRAEGLLRSSNEG